MISFHAPRTERLTCSPASVQVIALQMHSLATEMTVLAKRGAVRGDSIADSQVLDPAPELDYFPRGLMASDDRVRDGKFSVWLWVNEIVQDVK